MTITLTALHVYPVKSCRGIDLAQTTLTATGLAHDREWMIVTPAGRFVTQREEPRLALIETALDDEGLQFMLPGIGELFIPFNTRGEATTVTIWKDRCGAFDMGDAAAALLEKFLGEPYRLVRFNPASRRASNAAWTGETNALNLFSDGYPLMAISSASLEDLNRRLVTPLPMNRFRPNLVFDGLAPYGEDALYELHCGETRLRFVKPCTRCKITTIDQKTGIPSGDEPLATLKTYRFSPSPREIVFGQNVIPMSGIGAMLGVGQVFKPLWRDNAAPHYGEG